ncbi:MAG: CDP-glucose 4,6-dehydratase [Lachnospiraceae bacterium]|nr:CDP-glucose 4,6-dehydratase [Lachnospiraceae bacterium]
MSRLQDFYKGKKVLVTGHTGFKGSWLSMLLDKMGASVTGIALEPPTEPALFDLLGLKDKMDSRIVDICDLDAMKKVFEEVRPEIVIHMAAQPIVRESYRDPVGTYAANVMGTVNVLECCRLIDSVKSVINVTTDKVYRNYEWDRGYVEGDELCGYDPYSNSKSCSELVTDSYRNSFLREKGVAVSTVRAGNVIGGGDFATDRIIPDCVRAVERGDDIIVRNPYSTRPYQHVLEPLTVYLTIAMAQYKDPTLADCYNVGPDDDNCVTTGELTTLFCDEWNKLTGGDLKWINKSDGGPHEAGFLKLNSSKLKETFGWKPVWNMKSAMNKIICWTDEYLKGGDVVGCTLRQIDEFMSDSEGHPTVLS